MPGPGSWGTAAEASKSLTVEETVLVRPPDAPRRRPRGVWRSALTALVFVIGMGVVTGESSSSRGRAPIWWQQRHHGRQSLRPAHPTIHHDATAHDQHRCRPRPPRRRPPGRQRPCRRPPCRRPPCRRPPRPRRLPRSPAPRPGRPRRLRYRPSDQAGGLQCRGPRVLRLGDRPDHDDPARPPPAPRRAARASMPPMANHGRAGARPPPCRTRSRPGAGRPGLVGVGQHGPGAEVVDAGLGGGGGGLVARASSGRSPRRRRRSGGPADREVVLAQVQHVGTGGERDVRAVVDGQQRAVTGARLGEHLQRCQLRRGLERRRALVAQLHDVDPAGERGVGELGKIAALPAGVRCRGRGGRRRAASRRAAPSSPGTARTLRGRRVGRGDAREPGDGLRGSDPLRPSNLIRVMPAQGAVMSPLSNSGGAVGAGVIGLSCAWRAAPRRDRRDGARSGTRLRCVVGGGRHARPGHRGLAGRGGAARARRRGAVPLAGVRGGAGHGCRTPAGLRTEGTVVVATGSGDRAELDALAGFLRASVATSNGWAGASCAGSNPRWARTCAAGSRCRGISPWTTAAARRPARRRRGRGAVRGRPRCASGEASSLAPDPRGRRRVVLAAGALTRRPAPGLAEPIRPVKGEILRLGPAAARCPPPSRTVRALVDGRPVYAVPRGDGGLVIGATQLETGFDTGGRSAACATCCATPSGCCRGSPSTRWSRRRPGSVRAARTTCR